VKGLCHCGAAGWEIAAPPARATRCNCSFCRRVAVLWIYGTAATIRLWGETRPYLTGEKSLEFHHCATCGCITHWIAVEDSGPGRRIALNARLAPPEEIAGLEVRWFDGAETWSFVNTPFPPA
jgi:hypothetical protein